MSKQVETVSVAVEGVEPSVATTGPVVPVVDRARSGVFVLSGWYSR